MMGGETMLAWLFSDVDVLIGEQVFKVQKIG